MRLRRVWLTASLKSSVLFSGLRCFYSRMWAIYRRYMNRKLAASGLVGIFISGTGGCVSRFVFIYRLQMVLICSGEVSVVFV